LLYGKSLILTHNKLSGRSKKIVIVLIIFYRYK
jgi:hypothetical protein